MITSLLTHYLVYSIQWLYSKQCPPHTCRVTFRSLFYLKRQVLELLKKCRVHKMKVLCLPRWVDHYFPRCLRNCLFGKQELPELDLSDILKELKEVCVKREEELKAKQSSKWTLASKKITSIKQM